MRDESTELVSQRWELSVYRPVVSIFDILRELVGLIFCNSKIKVSQGPWLTFFERRVPVFYLPSMTQSPWEVPMNRSIGKDNQALVLEAMKA